jgi:hypothetical protein
MDEGRKRTILIGACILVSKKFAELGGKPTPALEYAIGDAITLAERIMGHIDSRYQTKPPDQSMNSYGAPKRS